MMKISKFIKKKVLIASISFLFGGIISTVNAQTLKDIQSSSRPLVLKAQGSFYVGGESVRQSFEELGSAGPEGHITVNQMYVEYMIPKKNKGIPIVMIHGMALTGKTWQTTPDGRMGWDEYFVRKKHPVYVVDQVGRGRSGFNQKIFNQVRTGELPVDSLPALPRFSDEVVWPNFRIGEEVGQPFPNQQFPITALDQLAIQGVPDMNATLSQPNPTYKTLSDLALQLDGGLLMSHSQSGSFPIEAALINPKGIMGMVLIEPGHCPTDLEMAQHQKLLSIPILIMYGDNLDVVTRMGDFSWRTAYQSCKTFSERLNAAGGQVEMWFLPDMGIKGNSHMIMQDKNHLEVADLIIDWIEENVNFN